MQRHSIILVKTNRLKYIITLAFTLCAVTYGYAQAYMYVQSVDNILYYRLSKRPTLSYSETELTIETEDNTPYCIPISKIKDIRYVSPTATGIFEDTMTCPIKVYTISGQHIVTLNRIEEMNTLNLPYGVYILQKNQSARKVVLQ